MNNQLLTTKQSTKKSKLQSRYEQLVADIRQNEALQKSLENDFRKLSPRIEKEIRPLLHKQTDLLRKRLFRLDELADTFGVDRAEQKMLDQYIADEVNSLLNSTGFSDDDLIDLYRKYTGESPVLYRQRFEGEETDEKAYISENAEANQRQLAENVEREEAKILADFDPNETVKLSKPEQLLLRDAKAVYVRLVKRFHPDLELDEQQKIAKTAIVQEVTKAYKENDFLKLLSLQIEHFDEKETEGEILADDMLKRYTKILTKQLAEIKSELATIKRTSGGLLESFFDATNKFSERKFRNIKKQLKANLINIEDHIRSSNGWEKEWFRNYIREIKNMG